VWTEFPDGDIAPGSIVAPACLDREIAAREMAAGDEPQVTRLAE
jgi:hypothetical protein